MNVGSRIIVSNQPMDAVAIVERLCHFGYKTPPTSDFMGRVSRNIRGEGRRSTKADAWNGILIAILTTQERSGRDSRPADVLNSGVIGWRRVNENPRRIDHHIQKFRFNDTKRRRVKKARRWLDDNWGGLRHFQGELDALRLNNPNRYKIECEAANFMLGRNGGLDGVGQKQARNFWQYLGYTVWTIPLDSRVQKVLTAPPFSIVWKGRSLTRRRYLDIEQYVIDLCRATRRPKAYPVLLDSALFNMQGLIRDYAGFPRHGETGFAD